MNKVEIKSRILNTMANPIKLLGADFTHYFCKLDHFNIFKKLKWFSLHSKIPFVELASGVNK